MTILQVKNTVLLHDGTAHGLHDDAGGGIVDLARLLVQLLGEQVDAQVAVLAGRGGGRDADDLARVALQHQDVADADVVARDRDCVGQEVFRVSDSRLCATPFMSVVMVMMVTGTFPDLNHLPVRRLTTQGVDNPVRHLVEAVAEGVIVA